MGIPAQGLVKPGMITGLLLVLMWMGQASAQTYPPYRFEGKNLPVPPQQAAPWSAPPTRLAPVVVDAMIQLFSAGLADPRGCEYREIEVPFGQYAIFEPTLSEIAQGLITRTHGWVLPGKDSVRFAIGWNGVIYPVVSVGHPVDLRADVAGMLQEDSKVVGDVSKWKSLTNDLRPNFETALPAGITLDQIGCLRAALLFRLGQTDLSEAMWAQWFIQRPNEAANDPYHLLAQDFAMSQFAAAISAHERGDDRLALVLADSLTVLGPKVEAEAGRRKLPRPLEYLSDNQHRTYLPFLRDLPQLIADTKRRLEEVPYTPVAQMNPQPQGKERIALLVRDLELVYVPRSDVDVMRKETLRSDPIVRDLVKEGEAAIEPLLEGLQHDTRLTRTMYGEGEAMGVDQAAYCALCQILGIKEFGSPHPIRSPVARLAYVNQIRDHWKRLQEEKATASPVTPHSVGR